MEMLAKLLLWLATAAWYHWEDEALFHDQRSCAGLLCILKLIKLELGLLILKFYGQPRLD